MASERVLGYRGEYTTANDGSAIREGDGTMTTFPERWGFEGDLRKCIGRTIEAADLVEMPWGCTWRSAWAIRFTDGSRAFFVGGTGSGIVSPPIAAVEKSPIFTAEEYGEMAEAQKRDAERRLREQREKDERELRRLQERLGANR